MKIFLFRLLVFLIVCFSFLYCGEVGFYADDRSQVLLEKRYASTALNEMNTSYSSCEGENCQLQKDNSPFLVSALQKDQWHVEESFVIPSRNELEIVMVVDTSLSMSDNLEKLGNNLFSLLSHVRDKDWRMVFTSADHGDHLDKYTSDDWQTYIGDDPRFGQFMFLENNGRILKQQVLYKHTSQYQQIFKDTLTRESDENCSLPPNCQMGYNEQYLRSLQTVFLRSRTNEVHRNFFKINTDTIAILIGDEDERTTDSANATKSKAVVDTYNTLFEGQNKRLFGFGVIVKDEDCLKQEQSRRKGIFFRTTIQSSAAIGRIIGQLSEITTRKYNGKDNNVSICSPDYGTELASISKLTSDLIHSISLKQLHFTPDTVSVSLEPEQPNVSWRLKQKTIVFSSNILPNTKIIVTRKKG